MQRVQMTLTDSSTGVGHTYEGVSLETLLPPGNPRFSKCDRRGLFRLARNHEATEQWSRSRDQAIGSGHSRWKKVNRL